MTVLYSPHPRRFYTDGSGMGPGSMELTMTEWNLLSIFSRSLFSWDGSKEVPISQRHGEFDPGIVNAVRESMLQQVGTERLANIAAAATPPELLVVLDKNSINHLAVTKFWGSKEALMTVAEARSLVWLSVQPRKTKGKLVNLRALSPEQLLFVNKVNPWTNGEIEISAV